jgi:hypothetical protein
MPSLRRPGSAYKCTRHARRIAGWLRTGKSARMTPQHPYLCRLSVCGSLESDSADIRRLLTALFPILEAGALSEGIGPLTRVGRREGQCDSIRHVNSNAISRLGPLPSSHRGLKNSTYPRQPAGLLLRNLAIQNTRNLWRNINPIGPTWPNPKATRKAASHSIQHLPIGSGPN